jgi:hippurate hydrolase/N-acetyldiaminopimelate deacetylase
MEDLKQIGEEMKRIRRKLHQIPEIGLKEYETSNFIRKILIEYGFRIESVAGTGIIAYKKGQSDKKAIAFRADMDGLKVKEETGVEYSSRNENMMHACGHDGHMAILLGFAKYLSNMDSLKRDVVLIFQPAEEGPGGAEIIVNEGIFEKYNIEFIFGLHILPDLEEGQIGCRPGPMMAQTGEFDIIIRGKSGHGAMPHTAVDTIYVASQLITSYQSIISRNIEPIEGAVLTIGKIEGGNAKNIIADKVKIEGTIRAFNISVYNLIKDRMVEISKGLEKMYNVNIEVDFNDMYPPVINDKRLYKLFAEILSNSLVEIKPMMIAEDFSYYQSKVPGLFFMLGSRNEELGYINPLHSSRFNFNEEILVKGLEVYIKLCRELRVFG